MYWYWWSYWGIFTVSSYVLILRDIYSDLTEGYLQYHRMYWYLWSYWGIFTVSSYVLIPLILLRDILMIVYIFTVSVPSYVLIPVVLSSMGYLWSYWGIFTVSSYVLIPVILLRDIYSIIVCIDTCGVYFLHRYLGYLQYHRMYWYLWS